MTRLPFMGLLVYHFRYSVKGGLTPTASWRFKSAAGIMIYLSGRFAPPGAAAGGGRRGGRGGEGREGTTHRVGDPSEIPSDPPSISGDPSGIPSDPASISGDHSEIPSDPPSISRDPSEIPIDPASISGDISGIQSDPASTSGDPSEIPGDPPFISGDPSEIQSDPASISGDLSEIQGAPASISGDPSGEILTALDNRKRVTILYHGKPRATIIPPDEEIVAGSVREYVFFGMYAGDSEPVDEVLEGLRGGRYDL